MTPGERPASVSPDPPTDRLESWKEIADYLGKGVTTVRRWEREEGLPVRRMEHIKRGSVVAFRSELDDWMRSKTSAPPAAAPAPGRDVEEAPVAATPKRWIGPVATIAGVAVFALAAWILPGRMGGRPSAGLQSFQLTGDPGIERAPSLSPDGSQVAYHVTSGKEAGIHVQPVKGGARRRLTTAKGLDAFPRWSPDGRTILFTRTENSWQNFMLVPSQGESEEPQLLFRRSQPSTPAADWEWASWMPDGKSLLLIDREAASEPWAVFQYELASQRRKRITSPPPALFGDVVAAASPDGRRVAFARYTTGSEADLYVMRLPDGEPVRLTHDAAYQQGMAWTPDGNSLVYSTRRGGTGPALWRIRAGPGSQPESLDMVGPDFWPSIASSAGGFQVAYQRSFVVASIRRWDDPGRASAPPRVLGTSLRFERAVHYSPDGKQIAFASTTSSRPGRLEIWACNADGSALRQVTFMDLPFADAPRWSPNGAEIAFSNANAEGNRDIYIVNATGGSAPPRRFTTEASEEGRPSWSRDGRWIYFRSTRSGADEIWKKPVDGPGEAVRVTRSGGYEAFEGPDGRWLYFTRDRRASGLWRLPASGAGPEELVAEDVREGWWSLADDAVYFLRHQPQASIWRLGYSERQPSLLAKIDRPPGSAIYSGFSARADGRSFLFSMTSHIVSDIVLLGGLQ